MRPQESIHDLLDPVLDVRMADETGWAARVAGPFGGPFRAGPVSTPLPSDSSWRGDRRRMGLPAAWCGYHHLDAGSGSLDVHAALVADLKLGSDPVLFEAVVRILSHASDPAAALRASRNLSAKGSRISVEDVVAAADGLSRWYVPSEHPHEINAWPSTRLLTLASRFSRATGAGHRDLLWMRGLDPRMWYCVRAAFGGWSRTVPAFGIAAAFHWLAESQAGAPLPTPRLEKPVAVMTEWMGRSRRARRG